MSADALYWNSISFGSEESLANPTPSKDYIDPWDLENYAYIKEQLNSAELSSEASSSSEYPVDSNFYYVSPGVVNAKRFESIPNSGNYVAIDDDIDDEPEDVSRTTRRDTTIRIEKRNSGLTPNIPYVNNMRRTSMTYGHQQERNTSRNMPLTRYKDRSMNFSCGDYSMYDIDDGNRDDLVVYNMKDDNVPIYDYIRTPNKPHNFGLSKYGHLQIDYSCSWLNLDKYIYN